MILVTGATGTIGGELVRQLIDARQPVRVLARDARKVAHMADQVEVAVGDLDRPDTGWLAQAHTLRRNDLTPKFK